jgi:hypothetical protein
MIGFCLKEDFLTGSTGLFGLYGLRPKGPLAAGEKIPDSPVNPV